MWKWLAATGRNHKWALVLALVGLITVCSVLLAVKDVGKPWLVTFQVASAVAGAMLGNAIRLDAERDRVDDKAHPAIRHLFDQVSRLRRTVVASELWASEAREAESLEFGIDRVRVTERFERIGEQLRDEIASTSSSIDFWGDLAPEVQAQEIQNYATRASRLPKSTSEESNE